MIKKKRAQSAGSAAGLIAVITLAIVLYVMLLPPDVREDLLGEENNETNGRGSSIVKDTETIFTDRPGRLDFRRMDEYEHHISPFTLYRTTNSKELKAENQFHIKNGWFDKKFASVDFEIPDLENIDNVLLTFSAKRHNGILTINLNGNLLYESEMINFNVEPIKIPNDKLLSKNSLEFKVSEVGLKFWTTNEYVIDGLKIIGDITDISRQESKNIFTISSSEYENLEKAVLKFNPDCIQNRVGSLDIYLNNNQMFSGVPDCAILNTIYFPVIHLNEGLNKIIFRTNMGSYLIDNIVVKTELKEPVYPSFYFDINETAYEEIIERKLDVNLSLKFVESEKLKQADVFINGRKTAFSTTKGAWAKVISNFVEQGNNGIKIIPTNDIIDIRSIEIILKNRKED